MSEQTEGFVLVWNDGPNYLMFGTEEFSPLRVTIVGGNADTLARMIRAYAEKWEAERLARRANESRMLSMNDQEMNLVKQL